MKSIAVIVAALGIGSMVGLCLPKPESPSQLASRSPSFEVPPGSELGPMPRTVPKPAVPVYSERVVSRQAEPEVKLPVIITTSSILGRSPPVPSQGTYSPPPSNPPPPSQGGGAGKRC